MLVIEKFPIEEATRMKSLDRHGKRERNGLSNARTLTAFTLEERGENPNEPNTAFMAWTTNKTTLISN